MSGAEEQDLGFAHCSWERAYTPCSTHRPCPSHSPSEVQRAVGPSGCCFAFRTQDLLFQPCLVVVLRKRVGLAIDKVIHHDDVILVVIIRTWRSIAGDD